jgi:hypothetical protein
MTVFLVDRINRGSLVTEVYRSESADPVLQGRTVTFVIETKYESDGYPYEVVKATTPDGYSSVSTSKDIALGLLVDGIQNNRKHSTL